MKLLSETTKAQIVRLRLQNRKVNDIAAELKVSSKTVSKYIAHMPHKRVDGCKNPGLVRNIRMMYSKGKSSAEIGQALGLTKHNVDNYIGRYIVPFRTEVTTKEATVLYGVKAKSLDWWLKSGQLTCQIRGGIRHYNEQQQKVIEQLAATRREPAEYAHWLSISQAVREAGICRRDFLQFIRDGRYGKVRTVTIMGKGRPVRYHPDDIARAARIQRDISRPVSIPGYFTPTQLAGIIHRQPCTVQHWCAQGFLPTTPLARHGHAIHPRDALKFLASKPAYIRLLTLLQKHLESDEKHAFLVRPPAVRLRAADAPHQRHLAEPVRVPAV